MVKYVCLIKKLTKIYERGSDEEDFSAASTLAELQEMAIRAIPELNAQVVGGQYTEDDLDTAFSIIQPDTPQLWQSGLQQLTRKMGLREAAVKMLIPHAENFGQLSQLIEMVDHITNDEGVEYERGTIIESIQAYIDGTEEETAITRAGGLRAKAVALKDSV